MRLFTASLAALFLAGLALAGLSRLSPTPAAMAQSDEAWALDARWSQDAGPVPAGFVREPSGLAVDADGRVYVADAAHAQVHVRDGDDWVATIGGPGSQPANLVEPRGLAFSGGRLHVADAGARAVKVYQPDGRFVEAWTNLGQPWGIAALSDTTLWVSDRAGDRLLQVDAEGEVLGSLGRSGAEPGQLSGPRGLAAWPDGMLAVLDAGNDRVQVLQPDGSPILLITNTSSLPQMNVGAFGDRGLLLANLRSLRHGDRQTNQLLGSTTAPVPGGFTAVAATGASTDSLPVWATYVHDYVFGLRRMDIERLSSYEDWRGLPGPAGELASPRRLEPIGPDLEVLDAWPRVQRLGPDGRPLGQTQLDPPEEVLPLGSGWILQNDRSLRQTDGLSETWRFQMPERDSWLQGLARDPATGDLYSLDVPDQTLLRLSADGSQALTTSLTTSPTFHAWTDLEWTPDGRLLLVNRSRGELEWRDPDGALTASWPVRGVPLRATADGSGGAFVLTREGWIWRLDASGAIRAWWDAAADAPGRRGAPADLARMADGRLAVADAAADEIRVYARDPQGSPGPAPAGEGCAFLLDKWNQPTEIRLGDSTRVTLTVSGTCFEQGLGADVMLVVDRSGSMQGRKMETARQAAMAFVGEIDFGLSRVGLVTFNNEMQLQQGLSDDPEALIRSIAGFADPANGTNLGGGIQLAAEELATNGRLGVQHIILVMTDGRPEGNVVDADAAAQAAKDAGVQIYSVGFGTDVDPDLMRRIADRPEDYFFAPGAAELARIYTEIARRITGGLLARTATITDVVPSNMLLVESSVRPVHDSYVDNVITWRLADVRDDLELSYEVVPQEIGLHPTNREAWWEYLDGLDVPGRLAFPVPMVRVLGPPDPIYLPFLVKDYCEPTREHADVVMVIDTSSSMAGAKLDAAKAAAVRFVGRLELPRDQAGVVWFNAEAGVARGLGGDRAALEAAIRGIDWTPGTRIDLGLGLALEELRGGARNPENNAVVVLLTDGLNNEGPGPVLEAAARAVGAGIEMYAIGLGADVDRELMVRVAGGERRYFEAVSAGDLERIYQEIAGVIGCR